MPSRFFTEELGIENRQDLQNELGQEFCQPVWARVSHLVVDVWRGAADRHSFQSHEELVEETGIHLQVPEYIATGVADFLWCEEIARVAFASAWEVTVAIVIMAVWANEWRVRGDV